MLTAITGGIGSGKSYVCRILESRGISVYDCDAAAKRLMRTSEKLQQELRQLVGQDVYTSDGQLQKRVLADFLLASEANKLALNDVIHPAVAEDFLSSGMTWLESAILFESGFDSRVSFDRIVCVSASRDVRIQRIMRRDNITAEKAAEWIDTQMAQEEVERRSHFVIVNDDKSDIEQQVDNMLSQIKIITNK